MSSLEIKINDVRFWKKMRELKFCQIKSHPRQSDKYFLIFYIQHKNDKQKEFIHLIIPWWNAGFSIWIFGGLILFKMQNSNKKIFTEPCVVRTRAKVVSVVDFSTQFENFGRNIFTIFIIFYFIIFLRKK